MKSVIVRLLCAVLAVSMLLTVCGCSKKESIVVSDDPAAEATTPPTETIDTPVEKSQLTVTDMMTMRFETIGELAAFTATSEDDGRRVYMVQNDQDQRMFMLVVLYEEDGKITSAVLSYGDTSVELIGEGSSITGGIREIVLTDPIELPEMTMENLLTLDPTDMAALSKFAFTLTDTNRREYSVVNQESGKRCTLTVAIDASGTVVEATLSYGDVSKSMLESAMLAILDVMTAMEGAQQ